MVEESGNEKKGQPEGCPFSLRVVVPVLEREPNSKTELPRDLECLRQTVAAGQRQRILDTGKRSGTIQRSNVVVSVHDLAPIRLRVTAEARCPRRVDEVGWDRELVIRRRLVPVEDVIAVAFGGTSPCAAGSTGRIIRGFMRMRLARASAAGAIP